MHVDGCYIAKKIEWAMGQEYNDFFFLSTHQPSCMLWWGARFTLANLYHKLLTLCFLYAHTDLEDLHSRIWNLHSICINNSLDCTIAGCCWVFFQPAALIKKRLSHPLPPLHPLPQPTAPLSKWNSFKIGWSIIIVQVDNASLIMLHGMIEAFTERQ